MKAHAFPALYANASKGGTKYWEISVREMSPGGRWAEIVTRYGLMSKDEAKPSKLQETTDEIRDGKNIGKANETTPWQQAVSEAGSKWQKKIDKGYAEHISDADKSENTRPMLAHEFQKRGSYIRHGQSVFLQAKLDGVRCMAICTAEGINLLTRSGKIIPGVPYILEELSKLMLPGDMLDGELFSKSLEFEEIVSLVRGTPEDGDEKVEFWVFDCPSVSGGYRKRHMERLIPLARITYVKKVDTLCASFSRAGLDAFHDTCVAEGFEGAMIRPDDDSPYEHKRSAKLLKYKKFQDAEFRVVGLNEGRGKLRGHVGAFELETSDGKKFNAKMDGNTSVLKEHWKKRAECIGKMATVKFQTLTKYGIPRFPVVKCIREEE